MSNTDHTLMQGVELINRLINDEPETTIGMKYASTLDGRNAAVQDGVGLELVFAAGQLLPQVPLPLPQGGAQPGRQLTQPLEAFAPAGFTPPAATGAGC